MDMQVVAVPLFNNAMSSEAYIFRYRRGNDLFSRSQTTGMFDGANRSASLEMLNKIGLDAFTLGKPIFVPINYIMLLGDLAGQCKQPANKVVFLFEDAPQPTEPYLSKMTALRELGFEFAVSNLTNPKQYVAVLQRCKYFFLSQLPERIEASKQILSEIKRDHPGIKVIATKVHGAATLEMVKSLGYDLFEAGFLRIPASATPQPISPLKTNSIRLMNTVQDENFDFGEITQVIRTDTALTISLLKMVNAPKLGMRNKIKDIQHAVTMMGQKEVRKWVTTSIAQSLGSDRPTEITRISMMRAKFAENLAPIYDMAHMSQGLFLMGLFSVLDVILETSMEEALKLLRVSDVIYQALVAGSGVYYPVLNMVVDYEAANWQAVSRQIIMYDISEQQLSDAYVDALTWYSELINFELDDISEESDVHTQQS